MILKTFFNQINLLNGFLFLNLIFFINLFLITNNIQKKFFYFIINMSIFTGIALYYNLDGLTLIFLISELSIILIFLLLLSQNYSYEKTNNKNFSIFFFFFFICLNGSFYAPRIVTYTSFYNYSNIIFNDFFYIYNIFFEKYFLLTFFILLIITLYSIFFIILFYTLKNNYNKEWKKTQNIFFLRKQNTFQQVNLKPTIRIFKKN